LGSHQGRSIDVFFSDRHAATRLLNFSTASLQEGEKRNRAQKSHRGGNDDYF
jgi:hypothetical protein